MTSRFLFDQKIGRPVCPLFHLHVDHIDRPVMATDATGAVVWQARYTPFGGPDQAFATHCWRVKFPIFAY